MPKEFKRENDEEKANQNEKFRQWNFELNCRTKRMEHQNVWSLSHLKLHNLSKNL